MKAEIKKILGTGLSGGYGSSNYGNGERAGFKISINDYSGSEGRYHDEWAAHQNGGGQELVEEPGGEMATRLYGGGSLDKEGLKKLGLTEDDIEEEIKYNIKEHGSVIRQDKDVSFVHGKFRYSYKVIKVVSEIPVFVGEEEIRYGDEDALVFVHYHINSPVR